MGATDNNPEVYGPLATHAVGLKMYLNKTFNALNLTDMTIWMKVRFDLGIFRLSAEPSYFQHFENWPYQTPIVCHAEGQTVAAVILLSAQYKRPVHVCHVSTKEEIIIIRKAKEQSFPVTCEVCPHHLFMTKSFPASLTDGMRNVRPPLGVETDRLALWENLDIIDCFATDHGEIRFKLKGVK